MANKPITSENYVGVCYLGDGKIGLIPAQAWVAGRPPSVEVVEGMTLLEYEDAYKAIMGVTPMEAFEAERKIVY